MLSEKAEDDKGRKILKDVGLTSITQELVELRRKVWVLIPASLTEMVQRSM